MLPLGLASLAEDAAAKVMALFCCGNVFIIAVAVVALAYRSQIAAAVGIMLWGLSAITFTPWEMMPAKPSDDSDVVSINEGFAFHAKVWLLATALMAAAIAWVCQPPNDPDQKPRPLRPRVTPPESDRPENRS